MWLTEALRTSMCILKALATPSPDKNISMYPQNRLIQKIPPNLNIHKIPYISRKAH